MTWDSDRGGIRERFAVALETANESAGPNDDRAIVMALAALAEAIMLGYPSITDEP
jgi:hypothetical protein